MSNNIYDDELYNPDQKNRFLNDLSFNTKNTYHRVLVRASSLEHYFKKDLYNFNIREIGYLLSYLNHKTIGSCQVSVSVIQSYIYWGMGEGLRIDNTSPLTAMVDINFFRRYIDQKNILLLSKEEINIITSNLVNPMDAALVHCIFEGVLGKGYSEILNLKIGDIDEESNELTLTNDISKTKRSKRILKLHDDSHLIQLLKEAYQQKVYTKSNGNISVNNPFDVVDLADNDFIFRSAALNLKHADRAHPHLVLRKLKLIFNSTSHSHIRAMNLRSSGMLYELYRLYTSCGKLEKEEFDVIGERFDITKTKEGYYSLARQKVEFLNMKSLKEKYKI